jgi:prolyl-tRNA synthetase
MIVADHSIRTVADGVTGANKTDYHIEHVALGRDFTPERWGDISQVARGDHCGRCVQGRFDSTRGIEVGHIFKLGTKYSEAMRASYLDEDGKAHPFIMGCYGIGIGRTAAAAIEQHHDANGIIWPQAIAPFEIIVSVANTSDAAQKQAGDLLYQSLLEAGADVLYDDRDERAGVKFKDADLLGIPYRITVGKLLAQGLVELKHRSHAEAETVPLQGAVEYVKKICLVEKRAEAKVFKEVTA